MNIFNISSTPIKARNENSILNSFSILVCPSLFLLWALWPYQFTSEFNSLFNILLNGLFQKHFFINIGLKLRLLQFEFNFIFAVVI